MKEKFTTFYNLGDALREPGCALCRTVNDGTRKYFDTLLYEYVNDMQPRAALAASLGFCRTHAETLLSFRDGLGTALLHQGVLQTIIGKNSNGALPRAIRACPACLHAAEIETRYGKTLIEGITEPEIAPALERPGALCLPHVRVLISQTRNRETLRLLRECARRSARVLFDRLERFVAAQNASGPPMDLTEEEKAAWKDVVAFVSGKAAPFRIDR